MKTFFEKIGEFILGVISGILTIILLVIGGIYIGGSIMLVIAVIIPLIGLIDVVELGGSFGYNLGQIFEDVVDVFKINKE